MQRALAGLRIIETAEGIGVPYAGKLLADMGAQVIKIEKPGMGDVQRHKGPFVECEAVLERSLTFQYANSSKVSVELNLDKEIGRKALLQLLKTSNAWIRQESPEYWEDQGFGREYLSDTLPDLNIVSVNLFGDTSRYNDMHANSFVLSHMSGGTVLYPHGTGDEGKAPVILGGNFEEYDIGVVVAMGLLASALYTANSGEGQYLEISEYEARTMCLTNELSTYPSFSTLIGREGFIQKIQASLSYKTKDGWVNPFLAQTKEFFNMAQVMGKGKWIEEEWFQTARGRRENYEIIRDAIQEWMSEYTTKEAVSILQQNRVPMGPVATPKDVVEDEQLKVRGYFTEVESDALGLFKYPGRPFVMQKTPLQYSAAPALGSANEDILGGILSLDNDMIKEATS